MTDIIEVLSMRRSGHHAVMAWLTENLTGLKVHSWDFRLTVMGSSEFFILNEANLWQKNAQQLLNGFDNPPKTLMVNYEDSITTYSIFGPNNHYYGKMNLRPVWGVEPKNSSRFLIIRNFYNLISSRYHANVNGDYGHTYDKEFIELWKENARAVLNNNIPHIKFEDWLTSKEIRNQFLIDNFSVCERFSTENIKGTASSFKESKNVLDRHKMVDLPDSVKEMIKKDDELNYLIGALGYEYKKLD